MALRLTDNQKRLVFFAVCSGLSTLVIITHQIQFEPLHIWIRICIPILFTIGLIGGYLRNRYLRAFGWIGILVFIIVAIHVVMPGEDYIFGGPKGPPITAPRIVSGADILVRFAIWAALSSSLVWSFRRLSSQTTQVQRRR